ncbi:MAG TPA: hypothetical protein VGL89_09070 [Candidatus Koribacter sp.]|jgi:uncharacterized membrane protein HdeD (DUF308 family)
MIPVGWFFLIVGVIAVISSIVDRKSLMISDVDGDPRSEDKEKAKPTKLDRWIYAAIGLASAIYGWYLIHH